MAHLTRISASVFEGELCGCEAELWQGCAALAQMIRKVSFWFTMRTAKHFYLGKVLLVVTLPRLSYVWL